MLSRRLLLQIQQTRPSTLCLACAAQAFPWPAQRRPFSFSVAARAKKDTSAPNSASVHANARDQKSSEDDAASGSSSGRTTTRSRRRRPGRPAKDKALSSKSRRSKSVEKASADGTVRKVVAKKADHKSKTLKEALLGTEEETTQEASKKTKKASRRTKKKEHIGEKLDIEILTPQDLDFQPIDVEVPPIPMLSYGLDRVLFNPGVYRLQDPRSRVYNFDPYLEKIMAVNEFDFSALSEYKTSSKDEELLAMTQRLGTQFTGSTSSMSGILQHFHYLLSGFRDLNHDMLSRSFPDPIHNFSRVTLGPSAIFLRWKDGRYAIDADKSYDRPNIMSWLGHSLEKLLTTDRDEFERYRRSSPEKAPAEDNSSRCYHYSKLGNFLMRSQLDAHDPRLPGSGVFDLKTRAVLSIRMDHSEFETGAGYQLRFDRGEWESFEREFYDMTRATMLKYSLQVRMGRMDGIFVAYHNVERIFGFQYLSLADLDNVLHGQTDSCLGDQEFKLSVRLLDEMLQKATKKFPESTLRLHFHARKGRSNYMYIFAEPVTDEQADEIQSKRQEAHKAFERDIVGVKGDDPEMQKEWHNIQDLVDDEVGEDGMTTQVEQTEDADEIKEAEAEEDEEQTTVAEQQTLAEELDDAEESFDKTEGDLMGWTLVVRNRVNGAYVDRPENLTPSDTWTIEYHVKEIAEDSQWRLYNDVRKKRWKLIGDESQQESARFERYRSIIKGFSQKGRQWREEQDKIDERMGQQTYRPLGPGSDALEAEKA